MLNIKYDKYYETDEVITTLRPMMLHLVDEKYMQM